MLCYQILLNLHSKCFEFYEPQGASPISLGHVKAWLKNQDSFIPNKTGERSVLIKTNHPSQCRLNASLVLICNASPSPTALHLLG